jgi:hypothetical protein
MNKVTLVVGATLDDLGKKAFIGIPKLSDRRVLVPNSNEELIVGIRVDFVDEESCINAYDLPVRVAEAEKLLSMYYDTSDCNIKTYLIPEDY